MWAYFADNSIWTGGLIAISGFLAGCIVACCWTRNRLNNKFDRQLSTVQLYNQQRHQNSEYFQREYYNLQRDNSSYRSQLEMYRARRVEPPIKKIVYRPAAPIEVAKPCSESIPCSCCQSTRVFFPPYVVQKRSKGTPGLSQVGIHIVASLTEAQETIRLVMFRLTASQLTNPLIKAHQRGVRVMILTDRAVAHPNQDDSRSHMKMIRGLMTVGIMVKTTDQSLDNNGLVHDKFAVIDSKQLILGSMNWTWFGQFKNNEHVEFSKSTKKTKTFVNHFDELWRKGIHWASIGNI